VQPIQKKTLPQLEKLLQVLLWLQRHSLSNKLANHVTASNANTLGGTLCKWGA
jgi:hypothetical protein